MIISEKQIMHLMLIAKDAVHLALDKGDNWNGWAHSVSQLLDTINNQQSEELKDFGND